MGISHGSCKAEIIEDLDEIVTEKFEGKNDHLPLPIIGKIVSYFNEPESFIKIVGLCKRIYHYLKYDNPGSCSNVRFTLDKETDFLEKMFFVEQITLHFIENFKDDQLKFFPNLREIYIYWNTRVYYLGYLFLLKVRFL